MNYQYLKKNTSKKFKFYWQVTFWVQKAINIRKRFSPAPLTSFTNGYLLESWIQYSRAREREREREREQAEEASSFLARIITVRPGKPLFLFPSFLFVETLAIIYITKFPFISILGGINFFFFKFYISLLHIAWHRDRHGCEPDVIIINFFFLWNIFDWFL